MFRTEKQDCYTQETPPADIHPHANTDELLRRTDKLEPGDVKCCLNGLA